MIDLILILIVLFAAGVIVLRAEPALNRMGSGTPLLVRLSFLLMVLGASAEILLVLIGSRPSWPTAIVFSGIAVMLVCERRLCLLCSPIKKRAQ